MRCIGKSRFLAFMQGDGIHGLKLEWGSIVNLNLSGHAKTIEMLVFLMTTNGNLMSVHLSRLSPDKSLGNL